MVEFSNLGLLENQSIIKLNVSAIQTITDNLPNSGALTDIAQIVNQSVIIVNQSTILDSLTTDATASNQSAVIANQTLISDDIDITIANTSTLLNNLSSGEIGDATLVNQSTILDSLGTDATVANQSIIITNQSTILDTVGNDASAANQTAILTNQTSISDNLGLTLANTSTILDASYGDATISNQSTILQYNQTIDGIADTIQAVTDLLPDAGALTSIGSMANQSLILTDGDSIIANTSDILQNISSGEIGDATLANQSLILNDGDNILTNTSSLINSNTSIDSVADAIKTVTDLLPDSGALSSLGTVANQSLSLIDGDSIQANQSVIVTNQSSILDLVGNDATLVNQSVIIQYNQTIDSVVDTIDGVTALLPDGGALTSLGTLANQSLVLVDGNNLITNTSSIIQTNSTIDSIVDGIKTVTDNLPNSGALTDLGQVLNQSIIIANQSTILNTSSGDASIANQSVILQFNQTIDNVVDTIRVITDALPDGGALTSIGSISNQSLILVDGDNILSNTTSLISSNSTIDSVVDTILTNTTTILTDGNNIIANTSSIIGSNATIDTVVDAVQAVTDSIPDSGAMTSIGSTANQSLILTDGKNLILNTSSLIQTNATIDNIVDTILTNTSSLLSNSTEVSGNYNLSTASGPHTVFTISVSERKRLASVFLDLYNLSYANNIRIDHKIDGTNYRTIVNTSWAVTDDDGMYFNKNLAFTHDLRLTMTNGTSGNATVPYYYILESME